MGLGNDPILMGGYTVPRDKYTQGEDGKITLTAPTINVSNKEVAPSAPVPPVEQPAPQPRNFAAEPQVSLEQATGYNTGSEVLRSGIGQGLLMGFGDELEAMLRTGQISGEEYLQVRDELRKKHELFRTEYPVANAASEITGGVLFPFGRVIKGAEALGIGKGITAGLESGNLGARMKAGAKIAAPTGAVVGAGTAQELEDVPMDAVTGGVVGGTIGSLFPAAVSAIKTGANISGSIFKNITERMGFGDVNKSATKIIANKLSQDELTPADVESLFAEYRRLGVSDAVLADLGSNIRNLGYTAQSVAGKGKQQVEDFLTERTANIPSNIVKGLVQKAGIKSEEFGYTYKKSLVDKQRSLADQEYPTAYKTDVPAEPFRTYANRKDFVAAYQEAVDSAERLGEPPLPPLSELQNADFVPTELLHQIKIGLDKVIEREKDALGRYSKKGAELSQVKREFNDKIKQYNPEYAAANAKFADEAKIQSAFDLGSTYQSFDADQLMAKITKFSDAEKEAFRVGLLSYAKRQLSEHKGGNFINKIFASDKQKAAMRNVFDTPEDYQNFVKQLKLSSEQVKTGQKVLGGSPTAERLLLQQEDNLALDVAQNPTLTGILSAIVKSAKGNVQMSPRTAEAIKTKLFNANPREQQLIINEVKKLKDPSLMQYILNAPIKSPRTPALVGSFGLLD